MSPVTSLLLGLLLGTLCALVTQWSLLLLGRTALNRLPGQIADILALRQQATAEEPTLDAEVVEEAEEPQEAADEPMDMHPDIPPVWRTARVDRPDLHCSCHGNPVMAGDKLLWWTRPDNTVVLYCPEVVDDAAAEAGLA